jgi:hypothetical protein
VRRVRALGLAGLLAAVVSPLSAQTNNLCDLAGEAPDVIVGSITGRVRHGSVGGITAFSIGTTSCNVGTCWLDWIATTNAHPVIGQNMFRLENHRFEQIGQSWLKHGYNALQETFCSTTCMPSDTGAHLGVRCSDPYSATLNGEQSRLGPKFEVNAFTGDFPFPPAAGSGTVDAIYKRLQVHNVDLDPAQNAGASYFVEAQYVTGDDARAGKAGNNASYRPITVSGTTSFDIALVGATVQSKLAIEAWKAAEPAVTLSQAQAPGDGRFYVASLATDLGGGTWHYEYAIHNFDSQRAAGMFRVPIPPGATITNLGFHDVDYHSGEPFSGTDWTATVGGSPPDVSWSTQPYAVNPNANALRWGTLYNFRFDANVPPATTSVALGLFRPGTGSVLVATAVTPRVCDGDAVCDPGETCARCPSECGGIGTPVETACGNGADDDCDGKVDCDDTDCCGQALCLVADADADGRPPGCDCDDTSGSVWSTPGEVPSLTLRSVTGATELTFQPPPVPGASVFDYELIRSSAASDFLNATTCPGAADPSEPLRLDTALPASGASFFYLVRARNACPNGEGPLGVSSSGEPHAGACP